MKKRKKLGMLIVIFFLLIGSFSAYFLLNEKWSKNEAKPKITDKKDEEVKEKPKLKILDVTSKSRPYAVMINNISVARPYQSGLQDAYIIYEMMVEGGITRYLALFKDQDTARIGTIRSARPYYLDYALENDAIYVHWGYSYQAQEDLSSLAINNINGLVYGNKYFWKDKTLKVSTEHTAYSSMELLKEGTIKLKYRTEINKPLLLSYSIDSLNLASIEGAQVANEISLPYSKGTITSYTYDSEKKVYNRFVNKTAHNDYVTKEQYNFKNIITYKVSYSSIDTKGHQSIGNIGSGEGYFISEGYAVPITWEKKSRESQTVYKLKDGQTLKVNDGNTFIQIQPNNQNLSIT